MTERKRRGLGRGLGALINSDGQETEASGATAHAVAEPEGSEDVSRETPVDGAGSPEVGSDEGTSEAPSSDASGGQTVAAKVSTGGESAHMTEDDEASAPDEQPDPEDQLESGAQAAREESDSPADESSDGVVVPERPIDVFFSAKSHLDTQRVSRGTTGSTTRTTSSRRGRGNGRVEMPDVLGDRARRSPHSAVSTGSAPSAASAEDVASNVYSADATDAAEAPSSAQTTTSPAEGTGGESPTKDAPSTSATSQKFSAPKRSTKSSTTEGASTTGSGPADSASAEANGVSPDAEAPPAVADTDGVSRGTADAVDGAEFRSVSVEAIVPNPRQPRQEFDEEDMAELVHSVREIGVLQPIVVRRIAEDQYELVMGERRWRASKAAERSEIPAIIRATDDIDLLRDALLENIHRSELNPLEEAAAYRQLLDDFQCTQDELATRIGRSRPQISNTLRLMKLPPGVQRRVAAGVLSSGHARALLGLSTQGQMEELAARIVAEGLSVRATEEAVTMMQQPQDEADVSRETADRLPSNTRYQQLDEYADALTDRLDTQVKITLGARKGRIAIDFGSIEDLHRLMEMIGQSQNS
ncbi:ParB/RepB/Spo0J family partition protein [Nesterenkonia sp. F]|uniref:ParB/RepB/Spo0J family partition protein n=1 Tax=Nesterenkonia sp. F TaxID=795955 RepID=UPI00030BAF36|nr:ParB/RepB/Spo0J family partition protein [Nesterenkonia sp. F]